MFGWKTFASRIVDPMSRKKMASSRKTAAWILEPMTERKS